LDLAAQALYEFTWHEFCDWYLELTKPVLTDPDASPAVTLGTRKTLAEILGGILRLLHPLMPFVTEELWLELCAKTGRKSATIMLEPIPSTDEFTRDSDATEEIAWIKDFVIGIRQVRGEMNISPAKRLPVLLADLDGRDEERLQRNRDYLKALARLERIESAAAAAADGAVATALVRQFHILVPLAGLIDVDAERARLNKQRGRLQQDLGKTAAKLANQNFVANAPPAVVQKERDRAADLSTQLQTLDQQLSRL
jgi:valyl-tRNA synthetase